MRKAGLLGTVTLAVLLLPLMVSGAEAQANPVQIVTYSASDTTNLVGWDYCYCCYCSPTQRSATGSGANLDMTWIDQIGYTYVSIQVEVAWGVNCPGNQSIYNIFLNPAGANLALGAGTPASTTCSCYNPAPGNTTQTFTLNPGNSDYIASAANVLRFTYSSSDPCAGIMNNSSGWTIRLTITGLNQPPDDILVGAMSQLSAAQGVGVGGIAKASTVTLRGTVNDPDGNDCYLQVEVQPTNVFFTGTPNFQGLPTFTGTDASADATALVDGPYHWQGRAVDPFGFTSNWVSFGNNSEIATDFAVDTSVPAVKATIIKEEPGKCAISAGPAAGFLSPALFGLALFGFGWRRRR